MCRFWCISVLFIFWSLLLKTTFFLVPGWNILDEVIFVQGKGHAARAGSIVHNCLLFEIFIHVDRLLQFVYVVKMSRLLVYKVDVI